MPHTSLAILYLDGQLQEPEWQTAAVSRLEYNSLNSQARPDYSTAVRLLWSDTSLYISYECPYQQLTTFEPVSATERLGLWDRDVVELFVGSDTQQPRQYAEIEWPQTGETLDVLVDLPNKNFQWSAAAQSAVSAWMQNSESGESKREFRLTSLTSQPPAAGDRWKLNMYRMDRHGQAALAFSPILAGSFHTPARFGWL
ncbi:MAG UNVERIFIED_CONTAM: carbohydrate-binding family 9-like protein [Planctomycetaceae bacterium]|jgi:hypothetical protein